jgi:hypothetical protein
MCIDILIVVYLDRKGGRLVFWAFEKYCLLFQP